MNIGPKPPFTLQTAREKVKVLQALWNTRYGTLPVKVSWNSPLHRSGHNQPLNICLRDAVAQALNFWISCKLTDDLRDPKAVSASIGQTIVCAAALAPNPRPSSTKYLTVFKAERICNKQGWEEEFAHLVRVFGFRLDYQARFDLVTFGHKSLKIKYLEEYHGEVKHFDDPILKKKFDDYRSSKKELWKRNLGLRALYFDEQGKVIERLSLGTHMNIREKQRLLNVPAQDLDDVVLPLVRLRWDFRDVGGKDEVWRVPEYEI